MHSDILILKSHEIASILKGRELELIHTVRKAYEAHALGDSSLPHSTFLRFPNNDRDRVIALPAYLGAEFKTAGIKWVSSFPENISSGIDRASAVIVLNSTLTGRPETILEGSIISAKRTAASAALAAQTLSMGKEVSTAGLIGCGAINFEIARFLLAALPDIENLVVFDLNPDRAAEFKKKCKSLGEVQVQVVGDLGKVFEKATLISMATTATKPHISDLSKRLSDSTILHISLRDFSPEIILASDNIVDDVDHVCRAQTSMHLAEQMTGDRSFIRGTLADITLKKIDAREANKGVTIFSPFGLGVLDIAVAKMVCDRASDQHVGTLVASFLPEPWR